MADKRRRNVCSRIFERSLSGSSVRNDVEILRTLISCESRKFHKTWSKTSKNPIGFDNQHLFFDKFRTVFHTNGSKGEPFKLYKLPSLHSKEKIESAVIFETPLDQSSWMNCKSEKSFLPCLFGVSGSGYLVRQDITSGEIMQSVYLGKSYKFKHVFWETDLCRIAITSVHRTIPPRAIQDNRSSVFPILMYIAVFEVAPLRFKALIPISKDVFGTDVIDASLNHGILFTMNRGGAMKLFSLVEILEHFTSKATLGELFNFGCNGQEDKGIVGQPPYGLPVNTRFEKQPQLLLQVTSQHHFLSFGGYPWHYIASPKGCNSVFQVFTIRSQESVQNGLLKSSVQSIEQDHALFHADCSGRILHVGADFVR